MSIKQKQIEPTFPLPLAVDICVNAGLMLDPEEAGDNAVANARLMARLGEFQKLVLVNASLEQCMVAFGDYSLNKDHKKALDTVFENTPIWCKAYAGGRLMDGLRMSLGSDLATVFKALDESVTNANPTDGQMITFDGDDAKL